MDSTGTGGAHAAAVPVPMIDKHEAIRSKLVADVGESLAASLDPTANVNRLAQLVVPYLGDWSIVSVLDGDGVLADVGWWHRDAARLDDVAAFASIRLGVLSDDSFFRQAASTGEPVLVRDDTLATIRARVTTPAARELLDRLAPDFVAVLPMVARERTVGLLSMYGATPWTDEHLDVARDIANRAALAIDNSFAYARAHAARAEAEANGARLALLAQVTETLAGTDDPDDAVGRLARLVVPLLGDWCVITVTDEDGTSHNVGSAHRDPRRNAEAAAYATARSGRIPAQSPLATAMRTGRPVVVAHLPDADIDRVVDTAEQARMARSLGIDGVAAIPLVARGAVCGHLTLVTTHARGSHTEDEIAMAVEIAHRAGPVLESARAAQRLRQVALSMQRSVLAVSPPGAGLDVATRYRPAYSDHEIGGDWYDIFALPDGRTVLSIGDVMGHDVNAIAAMAQLRTIMRTTAWTSRLSPAGVLRATDDASFGLGPATFATAIAAELHPPAADGSVLMRWSNAGHLTPALLAPDDTVTFVRTAVNDIPLGVVRDAERRDQTMTVQPGAVLLFFTDGLVERRDRDIKVGMDDLADAIRRQSPHDLDGLLDKVLVEMTASGLNNDDVAMLAVRVRDV